MNCAIPVLLEHRMPPRVQLYRPRLGNFKNNVVILSLGGFQRDNDQVPGQKETAQKPVMQLNV